MKSLSLRKIVRLSINSALSIPFLYVLSTEGISTTSMLLSEPVRTRSHLESVLNEEIKKLGITNKRISAGFGKTSYGFAEVKKLSDGSYEIVSENGKNRSAIRHELYHIVRGYLDYNEVSNPYSSFFKYHFVEEPQAVIYQAFGIKL